MKVYKFGGASVRSAEGVKNLCEIVGRESGPLFVVVSAMGKTTNALERVADSFVKGDRVEALGLLQESRAYHSGIACGLFGTDGLPQAVSNLFDGLGKILSGSDPAAAEYEAWYDRIVGYGEIVSTTMISEYMKYAGMENRLLDMRRFFITDGRHRDANIDMDISGPLLREAVYSSGGRIFVGQGFVGGTPQGEPTTLGREGSDYSAAVAANILDAESLTIWKDVEGVLNADPKFFTQTVHIPELTYLDAIELAYSGAQIIHPKTIKPLQNKNIPLYVRPFGNYESRGSVIHGEAEGRIGIPVLILKHNQVLMSIRPNDFSFVLEERFAGIFAKLEGCGAKINLIQSSAVNLTVCIDQSRHLERITEEFKNEGYRVVYNEGMELLTIRGYDAATLGKYSGEGEVYLTQTTRKIARIVRKKSAS